jgi:alkylhydroperoxidase family enzyme
MREVTYEPIATPRGFPYPNMAEAPADIRALYDSLPAKVNLFRMLAHSRGLYVPLMKLTDAIFHNLALPKKVYEMVVLLTARRMGADYEWKQHVGTALKAGVRQDQIDAIAEVDIDHQGSFDEEERTALWITYELIKHHQVSERMLQQGTRIFGAERMIEIMLVVGLYQALAGLISSVDLDFNPKAAADLVAAM